MSVQAIRFCRFLGSVSLILAGLGCRARTDPQPESAVLGVQNSSDFQVNVFAIPSAPSARIRLGSVSGLSNGQLKLPSNALAAGGILRVLVDPIGSRGAWLSPTVTVSTDTRACLRVVADFNGDLGRSMLFTNFGGGHGCP